MKIIKILILLLSLTSFSWSQDKIVGFICGGGKEPTASQIRELTHVCIAFLEPNGQKGDVNFTMSYDRLSKITDYAKLYNVKTLISFGGGGGATFTPELLEIDEHRTLFISNLIQFVKDNNLDGIDCDIEPDYTSIGKNQKETDSLKYINNVSVRNNYNSLLKEIKDSLNNRFGIGNKILTATIGDFNTTYYSTLEYMEDNVFWPNGLWENADFINLMSYGVGKGGTGHGGYATVFGPEGSVQHWLSNGLPKEKMVYGVPFYGASNWTETVEYSEIINKFPNIDTTRDTVTYDFGNGEMLYDFNSITTLKAKIEEGKRLDLSGIMFWDLNSDLPINHPLSLLRVVTSPSSSPIHHTLPFDTIFTTPAFTKKVILSNHFSIETGDINYSIENHPNRHYYKIREDTLIITGDNIPDIGFTKVTIRATSSKNKLDIAEMGLFIIIEEREPILSNPNLNSSNWVISKNWSLYSFNSPLHLPKSNNQLHKISDNGDTIINFIGTTKDTSIWSSITLSNYNSNIYDLENTPLVIEYKSNINNPAIIMKVNLCDTSNTIYKYSLTQSSSKWQTDTITINSILPNGEQDNEFDYKNIKSFSIEIGSLKSENIYNFSLKRLKPLNTIIPITPNTTLSKDLNKLQLTKNRLSINSNYRTKNEISMYSLKGQRIWHDYIEAGNRISNFKLPNLSRGIYVFQLKSMSYKRTFKCSFE